MQTMNIAVPDSLKEYVQQQVAQGGYSSASEYIRELIRADQKDRARQALEVEVLRGLESGETQPLTEGDWDAIREEVKKRHAKRKSN